MLRSRPPRLPLRPSSNREWQRELRFKVPLLANPRSIPRPQPGVRAGRGWGCPRRLLLPRPPAPRSSLFNAANPLRHEGVQQLIAGESAVGRGGCSTRGQRSLETPPA